MKKNIACAGWIHWSNKFFVKNFFVLLISFQHFFITVLIDCTIALPEQYLFPIQTKLKTYHIESNNDLLVANPQPWLVSFVWLEILFQVPYFVIATYCFFKGKLSSGFELVFSYLTNISFRKQENLSSFVDLWSRGSCNHICMPIWTVLFGCAPIRL